MKKMKGIIFVILSAILYGFSPIYGKLSFIGGSNSVMLIFLRGTIALPILFLMLRYNNISLKVTKEEFKKIAILGFFGSTLTTCLLYTSYDYISAGTATTIHFSYPIIITTSCILLFKEKINIYKIVALIVSTIGIVMFFEKSGSSSMIGFILALISGFTYAFTVIYLDKSGLKDMNPIKLSFFLCLVMSVFVLVYGEYNQKITFDLSMSAWIYSIVVSLSVSIGALILFQIGLKEVGSSTAGILSMFEPLTSIIFGAIILHEAMSVNKIIGCILICTGVVILTMSKKEKNAENLVHIEL